MSYPTEPPKEHPSTYLVQDRDNLEEMSRLDIQNKMLTTGMGGVLPELADPTSLRRVLDVGCGTGGWLLEIARTYPMIEKLVGADISSNVIAYARTQAQAQRLDERVEFQTMDALRTLQFPASSFDLVNQRAGGSWLRTWEWKKILVEYHRVTRAGGIIRITEANIAIESNSPALQKLQLIGFEAFKNSGRLFTASPDGLTGELERLMTQHSIENVQTRKYALTYQAGTEACQYFSGDIQRMFRTLLPFFQKYTHVPRDYQEIYRQALKEIEQPNFMATWDWLTAWGTKPMYGEPLLMRGLR
jgi:ubiquinone/menaquinone biosynthesis C-methylase UbiE